MGLILSSGAISGLSIDKLSLCHSLQNFLRRKKDHQTKLPFSKSHFLQHAENNHGPLEFCSGVTSSCSLITTAEIMSLIFECELAMQGMNKRIDIKSMSKHSHCTADPSCVCLYCQQIQPRNRHHHFKASPHPAERICIGSCRSAWVIEEQGDGG